MMPSGIYCSRLNQPHPATSAWMQIPFKLPLKTKTGVCNHAVADSNYGALQLNAKNIIRKWVKFTLCCLACLLMLLNGWLINSPYLSIEWTIFKVLLVIAAKGCKITQRWEADGRTSRGSTLSAHWTCGWMRSPFFFPPAAIEWARMVACKTEYVSVRRALLYSCPLFCASSGGCGT